MRCLGLVLAVSLGLMLGPLHAQRKPTAQIDLGVDVVTPGNQALLPVTLSTSEDPQVAKVSLEVSFPAKIISFASAARGPAAEASAAQIEAKLRPAGPDAGEKLLVVEVSASKAIPQGVLLKLVFDVSQDAEQEKPIELKNLRQKAELVTGEALEAQGIGGTITVVSADSPIFACFFYMH